jgi:hypothetical protein
VKNLIVLLFVGLAGVPCVGMVAAQELLVAPPGSDLGRMVPELAMPKMPEPGLEQDQQHDGGPGEGDFGNDVPNEQNATTPYDETPYDETPYDESPYDESWESGDSIELLEPYVSDDYQMFQGNEAGLESTGTWIRRGFWYAEVDAVIFNRKFSRDGVVLIGQQVGRSTSPFGGFVDNQMRLNGTKPGAHGVPRLTLGRFLFRDHYNRDHVGEFTIYGGGEWTQESRLDVNPNNALGTDFLIVPATVDGGNDSFDFAKSSQFRYDHRFNSFELNYHVKDRMGRDHMEMEPSGHWVRRAGPSVSRSLLAGIRFFELNEDFLWTASDIDVGNDGTNDGDGSVKIHTDNDLIGTQLGVSWMYETARWSGGVRAKGGVYLNVLDIRTGSVIPNATDTVVSDSALDGEEMSFIGEAAFIGKWHLRPNFSLRAGFETMLVTSTALAPAQGRNAFLPSGPSSIASSGDSVYLGASIGFEGYW